MLVFHIHMRKGIVKLSSDMVPYWAHFISFKGVLCSWGGLSLAYSVKNQRTCTLHIPAYQTWRDFYISLKRNRQCHPVAMLASTIAHRHSQGILCCWALYDLTNTVLLPKYRIYGTLTFHLNHYVTFFPSQYLSVKKPSANRLQKRDQERHSLKPPHRSLM